MGVVPTERHARIMATVGRLQAQANKAKDGRVVNMSAMYVCLDASCEDKSEWQEHLNFLHKKGFVLRHDGENITIKGTEVLIPHAVEQLMILACCQYSCQI